MNTAILFILYLTSVLTTGVCTGGYIYFAITARRLFETHSLLDEAYWAYFLFICLCYSATVVGLVFLVALAPPCLLSRSESIRGLTFIGTVIAIILLCLHVIATVHVYHCWHLFEKAGISQYTRQSHGLFAVMMIGPCLVSFILAILTGAGVVVGIGFIVASIVNLIRRCSTEKPGSVDSQLEKKTVPEMGEV